MACCCPPVSAESERYRRTSAVASSQVLLAAGICQPPELNREALAAERPRMRASWDCRSPSCCAALTTALDSTASWAVEGTLRGVSTMVSFHGNYNAILFLVQEN